jgi:hypothetical protein
MYHDAQGNEHEDLEMDSMQHEISLDDMEQSLHLRISYLTKRGDDSPDASWEKLLRCYEALAQIQQARAAETIASILTSWHQHGLPVERGL